MNWLKQFFTDLFDFKTSDAPWFPPPPRPMIPANRLAELRALIADDAWSISFQSFGQYRTALLKAADEIAAGFPNRSVTMQQPKQDSPLSGAKQPNEKEGTPAILVSGSGDRGREPKGSGISGEGGEE